jgi:hypothetical protein
MQKAFYQNHFLSDLWLHDTVFYSFDRFPARIPGTLPLCQQFLRQSALLNILQQIEYIPIIVMKSYGKQ